MKRDSRRHAAAAMTKKRESAGRVSPMRIAALGANVGARPRRRNGNVWRHRFDEYVAAA